MVVDISSSNSILWFLFLQWRDCIICHVSLALLYHGIYYDNMWSLFVLSCVLAMHCFVSVFWIGNLIYHKESGCRWCCPRWIICLSHVDIQFSMKPQCVSPNVCIGNVGIWLWHLMYHFQIQSSFWPPKPFASHFWSITRLWNLNPRDP